MTFLMIVSVLDVILMFIINPHNLFTWVSIISTSTFLLRRVGVRVKHTKIIGAEFLLLFLCINVSLLFKTFSIVTYLLMILVRCIFYLVVWYDDTQYVYITEEIEKEI